MLEGKKAIGTVAYMGGVMSLPELFVWSWTQMLQYNAIYAMQPNADIFYTRATVSYHSMARNSLADSMRGDWLLMLDTDIAFDPDLLARMLFLFESEKLDVLSGLYLHKGHPHPPVLYTWSKDGEQLEHLGDWDKPEGRYLIPIASAGAGCLLVRRSVFERIREELKESPFDIIHPYGEDHSFFRRLKKLGIQAYCDPSVEVNHLAMRPLGLKDYQPEPELIGERREWQQ